MVYTPLPIVTVPLSRLQLDLENYRIPTKRDDEAAALDYLFTSEDVLGSAREILRNGYLDNEVPIVMESTDRKYVVLEGNRRVSALKALNKPALVPNHSSSVRSLLKRYEVEAADLPKKIRVIVVANRDAAGPHIARLHSGTPKRGWSRDQQATYYYSLLNARTSVDAIKARYPDEAVVRYIKMAVMRRLLSGVKFSDRSLHDYVTGPELTMSAFEYAYRSKEIASRIGVKFSADGLLEPTTLTPDKVGAGLSAEHRAALEYLMNRFRAEGLNTRSPHWKKGTAEYEDLLSGLDGGIGTVASVSSQTNDELPDQANALEEEESSSDTGETSSESTTSVSEAVDTPPDQGATSIANGANLDSTQSGTESRSRGPNHPTTRSTLELGGIDYTTHTSVQLQHRYHELRAINITQFPAATAMLLRSILETTIKFHFEGTSTPATGELAASVGVLANAYGNERPVRSQIGQIRSAGADIQGSVQWFNLVSHSADFVVTADDLRAAWLLVSPVLRRLLRPGPGDGVA